MRNTEERVNAALLGAKKLKRQQTKRRTQVLLCAASLCLVLVLAITMPTLVESQTMPTTSGFSASIFANSQSLSYIIIAITSFVLGVLFSLLCGMIRQREEPEEDDD